MYKTIVVHVDGGPDQDSRLRAAALLAKEHGAHLVGSAATGISWVNYALLAGSAGVPVPEPESDFHGLREAARARLDAFLRAAGRLGVDSLETRMAEADPRDALLLESRYADLVVLSQEHAGAPAPALAAQARHLPEFLALRGARPVLVVPARYEDAAIPGAAVVGWDGSMQAMRAIAAALPLLRRAENVKLALINPDRLSELHGEDPGADMALYLARHGVRVEVVCERTNLPVGAALAALARDCDAGLMVAGAFGHSRYREWVLGGATRELLERAPVPLLLAH
ncbi:universal stress protein [Massilia sp. 9I]|uniref:universal stress protein n=1 Tax=Massilia sp. 9I TaxID=2653152 RepID=UPI0012F19F44|nr:universal stress protein [Massilia sp. 9I]VXB98442.1 Universal stress protein UspA and related nucleotide-binding proteins [Massilia sp. 9I]